MNTRARRIRGNLKLFICGLGVVMSVAAGTLAWLGTQSIVTCIAGAGLPVLFIISTMVFGRETSMQ